MSLEKEIKELVCAGFSGIWVESMECDDAVTTIRKLAEERKWGFDVWDIDQKLMSGMIDAPGPLQAIRAMDLPKTHDTQILVLKNFHRYLPNPEVVQALANRVVRGKGEGRYIVIVSPTVALQPEVEKLFTVVHHELPDETQLKEICNDLFGEGSALKSRPRSRLIALWTPPAA